MLAGGGNRQLHLVAHGVVGFLGDGNLRPVGQRGAGGSGGVEVHDRSGGRGHHGPMRGEHQAARAAHHTATQADILLLDMAGHAFAGEGGVIGEPLGAGRHRAGHGVVEREFQLVGPDRVAGQPQQLRAQLHPGDRGAGFLRLFEEFSLLARAVAEELLVRDRAINHPLVLADALAEPHRRVEILPVAGGAVEFADALEAGHDGVGVVPVGRLARQRVFHQVNSLRGRLKGLVPLGDDGFGELQVTLVPGALVKQSKRFEDRAVGCALQDRMSCFHHLELLLRELVDQVVGIAAGGVEHGLVSGQVVRGQQAEQDVLAAPDIPGDEAVFRVMGAEIAVRLLPLHHLADDPLQLRAAFLRGLPGVGQRRGGVPFAPILAAPVAPAAAVLVIAKLRDELVGVQAPDALLPAKVEFVANPALHLHGSRRGQVEGVGDGGDRLGDRISGAGLDGEQRCNRNK